MSPPSAPAAIKPDVFVFPLSFGQQRLWLLAQFEGASAAYHMTEAVHLRGELQRTALEQALNAVVARHDSLRTHFAEVAGQPSQVVVSSLNLVLPLEDLSALDLAAREPAMAGVLRRESRQPFNLGEAPLARMLLVRLAEREHVLVWTFHHIISDGWSAGLFKKELSTLYDALANGRDQALEPLAIQYPDYTVWQRQWLQGAELERQLAYWRRQLAELSPFELPTDYPRPAQLTYVGARHTFALSPAISSKLKEFNQKERTTPFMSLLAAFQILLARYSEHKDIAVGTPIANRQNLELEPVIGFLVNTLVIRTRLADDASFRAVVAQVRNTALEAYEHQDLPFEKLVEELNPERDPSRHPLFQIVFAVQNVPQPPLKLTGLETSPCPLPAHSTHFDVEVHLWAEAESWRATFLYNTDLFVPATIARLADHYVALLEAMLTDPERPVFQWPMLSTAERQRVLVEWNRTERDYPRDQCIHQIFEEQAARTPEAVAVVFEGASLTYGELNVRADQLARHLQALGVRLGDVVGLRLERSLEMIAGILGVLKSGGVYWAWEENLPEERLRLQLAETQPRALLVRTHADEDWLRRTCELGADSSRVPKIVSLDDLFQSAPAAPALSPLATLATHPAYLSYTSGSTGRPKGVLVPHRGVVRLVKGADYVALGRTEVLLHLSPLAFDASTFEIWGALLNGGRVILLRPGPPALAEIGEAIRHHGVTTLWLTAGLFHLMVSERIADLRPLQQLLAGGDVLLPPLVRKARRELPQCRIINGYGPTENTTFTCAYTVSDENAFRSSVPIGRPIANTQVYVLDPQRQPVPVGMAGELYAGGDGVACGYLNQPELTAERFIPDPFSRAPEARLYRTGDRVRWRADGNLEFLGRRDAQIKIRGYRVELEEIEAVLRSHPGIREALVVARADQPGEKQLVAYLLPNEGQTTTDSLLRKQLASKLPAYMLPQAFVWLDQLPLTANGKVDRRALEKSAGPRLTGTAAAAPRNDAEMKLCAIWQKLLGLEHVGIHDNFFEVGGHSLLAMKLVTELQIQFEAKLPLAALFAAPTIAELAEFIEGRERPPEASPINHFRGSGGGSPLFYIPGIHGFGFLPEAIASRVGESGRFFDGFEYPGLTGPEAMVSKVEELAASLLPQLEKVWPEGPCLLAGYSFGGTVAFELARQLQAKGRNVPLLVLLDSSNHGARLRKRSLREMWRVFRDRSAGGDIYSVASAILLAVRNKIRFLLNRRLATKTKPGSGAESIEKTMERANQQYHPGAFNGKVTLLKVEEPLFYGFRHTCEFDPLNGWGAVSLGGVEVIRVKGDHFTFLKEPVIRDIAEIMRRLVVQANEQNAAPNRS